MKNKVKNTLYIGLLLANANCLLNAQDIDSQGIEDQVFAQETVSDNETLKPESEMSVDQDSMAAKKDMINQWGEKLKSTVDSLEGKTIKIPADMLNRKMELKADKLELMVDKLDDMIENVQEEEVKKALENVRENLEELSEQISNFPKITQDISITIDDLDDKLELMARKFKLKSEGLREIAKQIDDKQTAQNLREMSEVMEAKSSALS